MRYRVEIDPHHFEHLSTPLVTGVMELIWNAIDADARDFEVRLKENSLGGIAEVDIRDDGHSTRSTDYARRRFWASRSGWHDDV